MKKILILAMGLLIGNAAFAQEAITKTGQVKFDAVVPAFEPVAATTNSASCVLDQKTGDIAALVLIKSFKFKVPLMEEHFNENYMESDKFPKASFKGTIADLSKVNFTKDGTYQVNVSGDLTLHGVTKKVTAPGSITIKGGTISASSKFSLKLADTLGYIFLYLASSLFCCISFLVL